MTQFEIFKSLVSDWIKFHDAAKKQGDIHNIRLSAKAEERVKNFMNTIGSEPDKKIEKQQLN